MGLLKSINNILNKTSAEVKETISRSITKQPRSIIVFYFKYYNRYKVVRELKLDSAGNIIQDNFENLEFNRLEELDNNYKSKTKNYRRFDLLESALCKITKTGVKHSSLDTPVQVLNDDILYLLYSYNLLNKVSLITRRNSFSNHGIIQNKLMFPEGFSPDFNTIQELINRDVICSYLVFCEDIMDFDEEDNIINFKSSEFKQDLEDLLSINRCSLRQHDCYGFIIERT